jgi:hypothetical protein
MGLAFSLLSACTASAPGREGQQAIGNAPWDAGSYGSDDASPPPPQLGADSGASAAPDAGGADASTATTDAPAPSMPLACNADPPAGAPQADPLPTYAGQCPTFAAAPNLTTFTSSGNSRSFMVVVPSNLQPTEKLPVIFMWYWLGGSADGFFQKGDVQNAVDQQRFIAVIPSAKGDLPLKWPFDILDSDARMNEEFQFFDDMLACVAAAFPTLNKNCVASVGVSAGALFTDQLASARANRLSSFESLSGGVGGVIRGWGNPSHVLPALVLWGGPMDDCLGVVDFQTESQNLETALDADGNFLVECVHNCGHAEPPLPTPPGMSAFAALWDFVFDHPFWLGPGDSPYTSGGLPSTFPPWCAIGAGKATPRTGACPAPPGC